MPKLSRRVWVGFSDGQPHQFHDSRVMPKGVHYFAVFPSRRAARKEYEDVRKAELLIEEAPDGR